jgi:formylmethanofuran--tetrahydromethanopterin N-formyltransferase
MRLRGVTIEDTYAEAFTMRVARVIITARNPRWAREAALKMTGFATSVIGCKVEAGIERELAESETPDGRPGISVLLLTMAREDLGHRLIERVGQTVLTCPTTCCFDGLPEAPDRVGVGSALRLFGDGFQGSKVIGGRRFWRIPVMEGEFLVEDKFGLQKGIGGGNFLILAADPDAALGAAEAGAEAIAKVTGVISPFPGGVVRSGSKVGARRSKGLVASTNDAYCPTLRAVTASAVPEGVQSVLEIVVDGMDAASVSRALRVGIEAACRDGVIAISAANFGGKLGLHHFHLRQIMSGDGAR